MYEHTTTPLLTKQLLDRQPAHVIGMLGTAAQQAITEACTELRLKRANPDTQADAREMLDLPPCGRTLERLGGSDDYRRGKIDPERDLPPNTVRLMTDASQ